MMDSFLRALAKCLLLILISVGALMLATHLFPLPRTKNSEGLVLLIVLIQLVVAVLYIVLSIIFKSRESLIFKTAVITNLLIAFFSII